MLKKRIIPIVLMNGFSVLKTIGFDERRNLGSPITVARTYNTRNVDELILLDIDATADDRPIDAFTVEDIAKECFMPLTVGGGVNCVDDFSLLLQKGADKVAINSAALKNPTLIKEASNIFGSQCVVLSIDVVERNGKYKIFSNREVIDRDPLDWSREAESLGAGEILINSVDLDGSMKGANLDLSLKSAENVNIPVIYAGGISSPDNCVEVSKSNISALGISSIFHFTSFTPLECKEAMAKDGIPVRIR
jgi:imidazole glycerol-phosphate synthase subunit HisF